MEQFITSDIIEKVRQIEIRTDRLVEEAFAGHYHSIFKGRGMNFDEVREYIPGDDIRTIDWNVTAREGRPFIKKFREERELTILLLIDVSASGDFGSVSRSKRELAAELGSVLAFSAVRNSDKVGLVLFSSEVELFIPPRKGRSHVLRVIREILFFQPSRRSTDITCALDFVNRVINRRAVAFLLSDFCLSGDPAESLKELRPKLKLTNTHHDLVAVCVRDPREFELTDSGLLLLEDLETGEQIELNTSDPDLRRTFGERAVESYENLRQVIRSSGVDLLEIRTDRPYITELLRFFQTRERRR